MSDIRRTLLFLHEGDNILLAMKKRGFGANRWNGVGGKLEAGETIEQALIRETQEEIFVTPIDYVKVAELDFYGKDPETNEPWQMFVYAYLCTKWEGEPTESEEMKPEWYKKNSIPYDDMWQDDEHWLPQVLEGKKIQATFYFDEKDDLKSYDIKEVLQW
jgi:8-oxo-dGTP pyrophosphatase MutT (NUDIX family)